MPIGVASISLIWLIPSASIDRTCFGRSLPPILASNAGTRLSRTIVVFPLPDIPVTTVKRPFGILTSRGLTVWMLDVFISMTPKENISSLDALLRRSGFPPSRNGPIMETESPIRSSTVPSAMILPPSAPAFGPSSIIQSDLLRICVSWSTRTTELPSATRSSMTPISPSIFAGWRPMEGSSRTYRTPVVLLRTDLASCARCLSPVDRVEVARSKVKYPSPRPNSRLAVSW